MYKKVAVTVALFALLTALLAACSIHDSTGVSGPQVHMTGANFAQSTITIKKGDSVTLTDDVAVVHIIKNGQWKNGSASETKEAGAPTVNLTFNGNDSSAIGPFTTSGTFNFYCTVHPGMNLTVTVQ